MDKHGELVELVRSGKLVTDMNLVNDYMPVKMDNWSNITEMNGHVCGIGFMNSSPFPYVVWTSPDGGGWVNCRGVNPKASPSRRRRSMLRRVISKLETWLHG